MEYFGFFMKAKLCALTNNAGYPALTPCPIPIPPLSPLFARVLLIRYDVSIKLQSKREEVKSVLCVWRAANYARRQNNEGGSRFPRLPAANYSFSRSCLSPFSAPILINHHRNCCCIVTRWPRRAQILTLKFSLNYRLYASDACDAIT